jgi:autotransporter-associated beta strand protein
MKSPFHIILTAVCILGAGSATADVLLRTDFQGRTLNSGTKTASGFSWTSELGEAANASTSLTFTGSATGFISGYVLSSGSLNPPGQPIPVAGNIETVGPWSTSFTFTPDKSVDLTTINVISYAISATGVHQTSAKPVSWAVNISGGLVNETVTASGSDPAGNAPLSLNLDFTDIRLTVGTTYTFTLTVSAASSTGNNIALNSIQVNALPAPGNPITWVGTTDGGSWDIGSTAHWKDAGNNPVTFLNFDGVTFDDTAATGLVTLAETGIQPFSVTFANAALPYTFSGEAWSGAGTLTKTGAGEVTLLIDNNLASTTISGGTLRIGNGGLPGKPGSGSIVNNAALVIARDGTVTLNGNLSGSGTLEIEGPGTTVLTGDITHTGVTTVSGGTLRAGGLLDSPVTVKAGATLAPGPLATAGILDLPALTLETGSRTRFRADYFNSDTINALDFFGLAINGSHSVDLIPTATWAIGDEFPLFTYFAGFTGSIANLQIGSAPHGTYTFIDDNLFGEILVRVDFLDSLVWKGNVNSTWDVNQTANWQLESNNNAAPFFTYDAVLFDGTAANTTVTVADTTPVGDVTFDFDAPTSYQLDGPGTLTGPGFLQKNGTGTLTVSAAVANTGSNTISAGTLIVGNGGTSGNLGSGAITNNGALVFNRSNLISVSSGISGSGTLTQQGSGTLTLSGSAQNTFTGDVLVSSGILRLAKASALGNSSSGAKKITVAAGAQFDFNGISIAATERTYTFRIAGEGNGTGVLFNNTNNGLGAGISSNSGVLNLELTGDATIGGSFRFDLGFSLGTPGVITGNGHTLTKTGTNQVMMRGDASASDISFVVNQGILGAESHDDCLGGAGGLVTVNDTAVLGVWGARSISTPVILNSGATLRALGGAAATWSGNFTLAGIAAIDTPSVGKTIAGTLGGSGGINKTGGSTLTLTANNTYAGPTTVSAGTLSIQHPYLADTAAVTVGINGVLNLDFIGTDVVGSLTIGSNTLPPGIYNASTHPGLLSGNGALEVVSIASDYDDWAGPSGFNLTGGPGDDDDGDGLNNFDEYAFGLDPTDPASVSPVTAPAPAAGTFTYTRRKPSLTKLDYAYESSTTLADWAPFTPVSEGTDSGDPVETITVTIPAALLAEPRLFLRVEAAKP